MALKFTVLRERKKVSFLRNPQSSSFLFPGRRAITSPVQRNPDPLIRQQVEWNVKQVGIVFVRLPIPGKYTLCISNNRNISYESTKDKLILQSLGEQHLT